jgi:hypothetical protein
MWRALSTDPLVVKENRASTSVETFPGTMAKISLPNSTKSLSKVASTFSSMVEPCSFPYATATSISLAYSGFLDAARIREGLVVASCGLYLPMATDYQYVCRSESKTKNLRVQSARVERVRKWRRRVSYMQSHLRTDC